LKTPAVWLALWLLPAAALAQDFGLDLTDDSPPPPAEETPAPPPPRNAAVADPAESAPRAPITAKGPPSAGSELEITQADRVRSIQRKVYLKKGRFELMPHALYSVNDPYYSKTGVGLAANYFLADTLAVGLRGAWMTVLPSDDVRTAKRNFQSRIFYSVPQYAVMANVQWSPVYGKIAVGNSILHFDGYLLGGAGVLGTETSATRGLNVAADLGAGLRFVARDFLAVNAGVVNTSYVDQPTGTLKAATQNILTLSAGVSVFLPLKSTGRESE
jgi:outer membrane beta-barrel protein